MFKKLISVLCIISLLFSQIFISGVSAKPDKKAPAMQSSSPTNNKTNVAVNVKISIKFSENIYKSKNFSKIKLTISNKTTTINPTISKNYLKVAHKYFLKYNSKYIISIPAYAVKDKAGNILKKSITLKFKTMSKPVVKPTVIPTSTPTATPTPTPILTNTPTATTYLEITANNDTELIAALGNANISKIILNPVSTYQGFTISYSVYINGNGAAVASGINVNADNVTLDNLNITAANNASGNLYNVAYQIASGKTGIEIKNGSVCGTLNKSRTKGLVCPSSTTSEITVDNVDFADSRYGIIAGDNSTGSILTVINCQFTNVDYGIGWTEFATFAEIKGNIFNAGIEGIGFGAGLKVTIPGQNDYSLLSYMKINNTFNSYVEFKDIADYRNLPVTPTPTPGGSSSPEPSLGPEYTPTPAPTSTSNVTFPLKVSTNGRYLVDQNNDPFYVFADTAHGMFNYPTRSDVTAYLEKRQQQGLNTILCFLGGYFITSRPNWEGNYIFVGGGVDLATPNDAYFENIDWGIQEAAKYGIQVIINPLVMEHYRSSYTLANSYSFGRYLGNRYKDFKNIIWCTGGDIDPTTAEIEMINEMARGISETDPNHLISFFPSGGKSSSTIFGTKPWLSFNMTQVHENDESDAPKNYQLMLIDYNITPAKPSIMIEPNHEITYTRSRVRRALTWSILSGSMGITYGNNITRNFAAVNGGPASYTYGVSLKEYWYSHLSDPAFIDTMNLTSLLRSKLWFNFKPDQSHTLIINGTGNVPLEHEATIIANDNSSSITYLPTSRAITINMAKFNGSKTLKWFDMTNNKLRDIGTFSNTGTVNLPARPQNSSGGNDWILVIE